MRMKRRTRLRSLKHRNNPRNKSIRKSHNLSLKKMKHRRSLNKSSSPSRRKARTKMRELRKRRT